mgnify:FL=1
MTKKAICWFNGKFVDVAKARISPLDRGFLFGEGLFETWRTYRGQPYGLADHLARMAGSARQIGIPFDPSEPWEERSIELARRNGMLHCDGAVRMTVTRGSMNLSQKDGGLPPDSVVQDEDTILADSERLLSRYHDKKEGASIRVALAPCSPFSVTKRLMAESAALAEKYDARLHTHLAETKDEDDEQKMEIDI